MRDCDCGNFAGRSGSIGRGRPKTDSDSLGRLAVDKRRLESGGA